MEVVSSQAPTSGKKSGGRTLILRMYTFSAFPPHFRLHFNTFYRSQPPCVALLLPARHPTPTAAVLPAPRLSRPSRPRRQRSEGAPSRRRPASLPPTRRPSRYVTKAFSHHREGLLTSAPTIASRARSAAPARWRCGPISSRRRLTARPTAPAARPAAGPIARRCCRLCKRYTVYFQIVRRM